MENWILDASMGRMILSHINFVMINFVFDFLILFLYKWELIIGSYGIMKIKGKIKWFLWNVYLG